MVLVPGGDPVDLPKRRLAAGARFSALVTLAAIALLPAARHGFNHAKRRSGKMNPRYWLGGIN